MTWVKICGITNLEDALTAVDAGADALGFVFYEKSPRNAAPATVREIVHQMPAHIEKVGVFVGNNPKNLPELAHDLGLTGAQLHFGTEVGSVNETMVHGSGCFPLGFKSYTSMPAEWFIESEDSASRFIASAARAAEIMRSHPGGDKLSNFVQTIFLDSGSLQQPGGTGTVFNWKKAAPIVEHMRQVVRVVVAGGLNPSNVTDAIHILKPWGVDVSSGVESKPGKKDPEKVRAFVAAVRQAERVE
ncbi:MAG: phosphoribosylanthranilate isomerase [Terriglobales bacterium]